MRQGRWRRLRGVALGGLVALACLGPACSATPPPAPAPSVVGSAPVTGFAAEPIDISLDWKGPPPEGPGSARVALTASDGSGLKIASLQARAVLYGPVAFTEVYITFQNDEDRTREGTFSITLPESAAVSRFAMKLPAGWQEAEVVERKQARRAFETFMHKKVDPALFDKDQGNVFRGRVFPILGKQKKEIIISWTEEIASADEPYRFALRGLPTTGVVDVQLLVPHEKKAFVLHREQWEPDRDFAYLPVKDAPQAIRAGNSVIARLPQPQDVTVTAPFDSVAILIDSSASQGPAYAGVVERAKELVAQLGARAIKVACFDQDVEPVANIEEAAARAPGGASDLQAGLRWLKSAGVKRAILVTDGLASAGNIDPKVLATEAAALRAAGVERLDAVAVGAQRNEQLLRALTTAGLQHDGVVADGDGSVKQVAASLRNTAPDPRAIAVQGSKWAFVGGGVVYADVDIDVDRPLRIAVAGQPTQELTSVVAPGPLIERVIARARIDELEQQSNAPETTDARRAELRTRIVQLSVNQRVLTPYTSMLVLESAADYRAFNIPDRARTDVLTVGREGVEIAKRSGPVFWDQPSKDGQILIDDPQLAVDTDRDGIPDAEDKCPNDVETFNGREDDDGCPDFQRVILTSNDIIILERVQFEDGSARILPGSKELLDMIALVLREHPEFSLVTIEGHTDNTGSAASNLALSKARADAVRKAIISRGIDARRLDIAGFGDTRPIESNSKPEGRERNRRVEFKITAINGEPVNAGNRGGWTAPRYKSEPVKRSDKLTVRPWEQPLNSSDRPKAGDPLSGEMSQIAELISAGGSKASEALVRSQLWRKQSPTELLPAIAEGRSLEAVGRHKDAARAYGTVLDLATKPEHRRAAAGFLAALGVHHPPALETALQVYREMVVERPEHPSSYRLLAHTLARSGKVNEAFEVVVAAVSHPFNQELFPGATDLLKREAALYGSALIATLPKAEATRMTDRLAQLQIEKVSKATIELSLAWETDASDLDLVLRDKSGASFAEADVDDGYGPEVISVAGRAGVEVEVEQITRGPSGFALGTVSVIEFDGGSKLELESRPFVLMNERAIVSLGKL